MKKLTIITWIGLILLTIIVALFSGFENNLGVFLIIGLSVIKFLAVAFEFMELKKTHSFWKITLLFFIVVYSGLVLMIN